MNWLSFIGIFAKPVGAIINKGIAAGAAAAITWAVSKGVSGEIATTVVGSLVLAVSTIISGVAATQGVQIPVINADQNNGVKVVSEDSPSPTVNAPLQ